MPDFAYQAKNGPKEIIKGRITAANEQDAVRLIEEKGLVPIEVRPAPPEAAVAAAVSKPVSVEKKDFSVAKKRGDLEMTGEKKVKVIPAAKQGGHLPIGGRVKTYDVCVFTRQLAGFMKSSVPLLNALELITKQTTNARLKKVLESVAAAVRGGERFSDSLEKFGSRHFDSRYISMVSSGEAGGSLDSILETLADFLEKEEELKGQVRAALAYPILVVLVGLGTIFFLFTFCIPRLSTLFNRAYGSLPLPTKILMSFSQPAWQIAFWGGFVLFALFAFSFFGGSGHKKERRERFLARIPVLGTVKLKSDIARFCGTLAMLIQNGIPIYQAIETTRPVLSNEALKKDLETAQNRLLGGEMLAVIVRQSPHFPPFVSQMIAVGEESGRLVESLREVDRFYSRESLRGIKILTSLIEPAFILLLSLVIGFVVAGILLPIFDMKWIQ
ncbi:MAG: type II secretion system F family protein [Candidatus Omnitrophica bacterium]|nr:type II secretion system F family protein [Candidatus Omnitrophota bacterium]